MTHPFSPRPATGADRLVGVDRRRDRRTQAYHARNRAAEIIRRRKRMGPGGSRGLQIRRRRGSAGTGGFDSHTLPPLNVAVTCSRPALAAARGSAGCRLDHEPGLSLRSGSRIARLLRSVTSRRLRAPRIKGLSRQTRYSVARFADHNSHFSILSFFLLRARRRRWAFAVPERAEDHRVARVALLESDDDLVSDFGKRPEAGLVAAEGQGDGGPTLEGVGQ